MSTTQAILILIGTVLAIFAALALCDTQEVNRWKYIVTVQEGYVKRLEETIRYYAGRYMHRDAKRVLR